MQAIQKAFVTHKSLKAKATSIEEQPQYQNTAEARQSVASPSAPVIQEPAAVQTPAKSLQRQPSFRGDFGSKLLLVFVLMVLIAILLQHPCHLSILPSMRPL